MCGRYYVSGEMTAELRRVAKQFHTDIGCGRMDIYPSQEAAVLAGRDHDRGHELAAVPMLWGFPRHTGNGLLINARAETALDKPMFRDSLLKRRCVIPAGGFYEWNRSKEKVDFYRSGMPVLYMAGFYNIFQETPRFVILTTSANASVSPVHDRMPLILEADALESWIFDDTFLRRILQQTPLPLEHRQDYEQQTLPFL